MFIVGRTRRVNQAKGRAAVAAAVEAGVRGADITGLPIFVWTSIFSADPPAVMWSARVEHLADAVAADDALFGDEGFAQWAEDNDGLFDGPSSDVISQVVYGAPDGPPKQYVQVTRAVCANGSLGEAMGLGVELAETAARITGVPAMFVTPVIGEFGAVAWLSSCRRSRRCRSGQRRVDGR